MIQYGSIFNASFNEARVVAVLQAIAPLLFSAMLPPQIGVATASVATQPPSLAITQSG